VSVTFVASFKLPTRFGYFTMHGFLDRDTGQGTCGTDHGRCSRRPACARPPDIPSGLTGDAWFRPALRLRFFSSKRLAGYREEGAARSLFASGGDRYWPDGKQDRAYHRKMVGGYGRGQRNSCALWPPHQRDYRSASRLLAHLGINQFQIADQYHARSSAGVATAMKVTSALPLSWSPTPHNSKYLATKGRQARPYAGKMPPGGGAE